MSPAPGACIHPPCHLLVQSLLHLSQAVSSPLYVESRLMNNTVQTNYADSCLVAMGNFLQQAFAFLGIWSRKRFCIKKMWS